MADESERSERTSFASASDQGRVDAVVARLSDTRWREISWVTEIGSTNDALAGLASGAPEQVLVADLQTAGRGRRGRVWDAPASTSVLMSLLIRDTRGIAPFWTIGSVALAAAEVASDRTDSPVVLKWPNDLLIGDQKIAGVLAQSGADAGVVVVGIGINVNWGSSRPPGVPDHATALDQHIRVETASDRRADAISPGGSTDAADGSQSPERVERGELVADILRRTDAHLSLSIDDLRDRWVARCATVGARVRVQLDSGALVGPVVGVDNDGALLVRSEAEGDVRHVHVGDVVHLRPAH